MLWEIWEPYLFNRCNDLKVVKKYNRKDEIIYLFGAVETLWSIVNVLIKEQKEKRSNCELLLKESLLVSRVIDKSFFKDKIKIKES